MLGAFLSIPMDGQPRRRRRSVAVSHLVPTLYRLRPSGVRFEAFSCPASASTWGRQYGWLPALPRLAALFSACEAGVRVEDRCNLSFARSQSVPPVACTTDPVFPMQAYDALLQSVPPVASTTRSHPVPVQLCSRLPPSVPPFACTTRTSNCSKPFPAVDALSQPVQPRVASTAKALCSGKECTKQLYVPSEKLPCTEMCGTARFEAWLPHNPFFPAVDALSQPVQSCLTRTAPTLCLRERSQHRLYVPLKELPSDQAQRKPPSDIQRIVAEALPLFSENFQGPHLYKAIQEAAAIDATAVDADGPSRYSVFDTTFHARSRLRGDRWSVMDCVADAVASAGTRTKAVQVIDTPLPSLPQPQITLTEAGTDRHVFALPLDLRDRGLFVYTFAAAPGSTVQDVIDQLGTARQGRRAILSAGLNPNELRFRDAKGRVFDALSEPVTDHEWLQLVGLHDADLGWAGASTTPTTTAMQSHPPRLLGFELDLQPTHIPRALSGTAFTPIYIATEPGAHMPLGHMCLFEGLDAKVKKETPFVMLTKDFPPVRLVGSTAWSALDFCAMAARQCEQPPRHAQLIMTPLAGVPVPQIVITEQSPGDEGDIIPVDLRPFGGEIIPIPLRPGATLRDILDRALQAQTTLHDRLAESWNTDRLYVQDSQGHIYDQLPHNVRALEWLVVQARCETGPPQSLGSFQAPPPMWPLQCSSTSTTTTAMQSQMPMVSFVVVSAGVTVRSTVQPLQDVDTRATLTELFRGLIGLGRLRQSFLLQLSPVMQERLTGDTL